MFFSYDQLEKAKKKEAAFIVTFAKREQEIAELKVSCFFLLVNQLLGCIEDLNTIVVFYLDVFWSFLFDWVVETRIIA